MVRVPTVLPSAIDSDIIDEQHLNEQISTNDQKLYSSYIFYDKPNRSSFAQLYADNKEILLGSCAAITVFFVVLIAFIVNKRKSRAHIDKAPLVDNEVSANVDVERLTIHV